MSDILVGVRGPGFIVAVLRPDAASESSRGVGPFVCCTGVWLGAPPSPETPIPASPVPASLMSASPDKPASPPSGPIARPAAGRKPVYYADYLHLEKLLDAQVPHSKLSGAEAHDEMLFIIVHQAHELWFKQILHELDSVIEMFATENVDEKSISVAVGRTRRIVEIQKPLVDALRILETMTSLDFLDFRDILAPASGFQSHQFRLIENRLGLSPDQRVSFDGGRYSGRLDDVHRKEVEAAEQGPTLFGVIEAWLERTPFLELGDFDFLQHYRSAVIDMLAKDAKIIEANPTFTEGMREMQLAELEKTRDSFERLFHKDLHDQLVVKGHRRMSYRATVAALFINLYRDQPILSLPFRLLENLLDIDENMTIWRYRHALMVHRMIGRKIGTGGSSGHKYLNQVAESHKVFTDLFDLSTYLIPRSALPPLPEEFERRLGFYFTEEGS